MSIWRSAPFAATAVSDPGAQRGQQGTEGRVEGNDAASGYRERGA